MAATKPKVTYQAWCEQCYSCYVGKAETSARKAAINAQGHTRMFGPQHHTHVMDMSTASKSTS